MKNVNKIKIPNRIDIVMGGVSDLEWWKEGYGGCLSLACNIHDAPQVIHFSDNNSDFVELKGFGNDLDSEMLFPLEKINSKNIESIPKEYRLVFSSIATAFSITNKNIKGFKIINETKKIKGVGGSSIISASIIILICKYIGNINLSLNDILNLVICAEKNAEIGGGWEDVAGVYNGGINRVFYNVNNNPTLHIENLKIKKEIVSELKNRLIVVDSNIQASTEVILNLARKTYEENKKLVIDCTDKIIKECDIIEYSLKNNNIIEVGYSFTRQRNLWGRITNGASVNKSITNTLGKISENIIGFKEAGAGGGGTILILCVKGKQHNVENFLKNNGLTIQKWDLSTKGLLKI